MPPLLTHWSYCAKPSICCDESSNRNDKINVITRVSADSKLLQVPFSFSKYGSPACILIIKYFLLKFASSFSLARTCKRLAQPYCGFSRLCRNSETSLRTSITPRPAKLLCRMCVYLSIVTEIAYSESGRKLVSGIVPQLPLDLPFMLPLFSLVEDGLGYAGTVPITY